MTDAALLDRWKARPLRLRRILVARSACELQRRVFLVAEIGAGRTGQGNENATNESENVLLYLLPPPAAITTNCFFDFGPA